MILSTAEALASTLTRKPDGREQRVQPGFMEMARSAPYGKAWCDHWRAAGWALTEQRMEWSAFQGYDFQPGKDTSVKYEEKQLRRKLKRRILIMAALILVPAVACFLTWGTTHWVRYNRATGSKDGLESNYVGCTYQNGGINLGYTEMRNYDLAVGFDKNRIIREFGWAWGAKSDPRYAYTNDTPHGPRFAGFEFYHVTGRIGRKSTCDQADWYIAFPIWLLAIPQLVIIALTLHKLRFTGRKASAFPVEVK